MPYPGRVDVAREEAVLLMSLVIRKPAFCIYAKTKTVTAKLICVFDFAKHIVIYSLNPKFKASNNCACIAWFVSDLVGIPEDRLSHNEAQFSWSIVKALL